MDSEVAELMRQINQDEIDARAEREQQDREDADAYYRDFEHRTANFAPAINTYLVSRVNTQQPKNPRPSTGAGR